MILGFQYAGGEVHAGAGWGSWKNRIDQVLETFFPIEHTGKWLGKAWSGSLPKGGSKYSIQSTSESVMNEEFDSFSA